jgi:hypothetical protein
MRTALLLVFMLYASDLLVSTACGLRAWSTLLDINLYRCTPLLARVK